MREVLRHKLVATSHCAGPHRIAWSFGDAGNRAALRGCLCGSPERHVAQFTACSAERREHAV